MTRTDTDEKQNTGIFGENPDFRTEGAVLLSYKGTDSHLVIPEGIERVAKDAFFKNAFLKGLVLPFSLKEIEAGAFFSCKNLETVTMREGLVSIGDFAFADCSEIKAINIPDSVKHIGKYAFSYVFGSADLNAPLSSKRTYVKLPESTELLCEGSFLGSDGIILQEDCYARLAGSRPSNSTPPGFSSGSQVGRALYDPEKASGHWVDSSRFKPHLIVIKENSSDTIKIAVWMASKEERRDYLTEIIKLWESGCSFDFFRYDSLFDSMVSREDKINVAFYRLEYPYELSAEHGQRYEEFLKKHVAKAAEIISPDYKLKALQLLAKKSMLTADNVDSVFDVLNSEGNTKCTSWIMQYKNSNKLKKDTRLTL